MGIDDYAAWQGRKEDGRQGRSQPSSGKPQPAVDPAPLSRTPTGDDGISLDFEKRAESTTIVRRFRLALFKNRTGE